MLPATSRNRRNSAPVPAAPASQTLTLNARTATPSSPANGRPRLQFLAEFHV